jgi:hypothetical protein
MGKMIYVVEVKTSDDKKAGTNEDVWCQLVGYNGETAVCHFDKGGYDDFESGDYDAYQIIDEDVGPLSHIQFALTKEGSFAGEISLTVAGEFKGASAALEFSNVERWGSEHHSPAWKLSFVKVRAFPFGAKPEFKGPFPVAPRPVQTAMFTAERWLIPGEVIRISNDTMPPRA